MEIGIHLNRNSEQIRGVLKRYGIQPKLKRYPIVKAGMKFNRLTAIQFSKSEKGHTYWEYKCDCGNTKIARVKSVNFGETRSCGCLTIEANRAKTPYKDAASKELYYAYKNGAKNRNIVFDLDLNTFSDLIQKNCYICGIEPKQIPRKKPRRSADDFRYNGLDRVDNTQGYIKENLKTCCKQCNSAKTNLTEENFYNWLKRVFLKNKDKFI